MDNTVNVYETMAAMCKVSSDEMLKAIPVMLSGDTLLYYLGHVKHCTPYEEAIIGLRLWYNNADKRARILKKWLSLHLTEKFMNTPDDFEAGTFQKFVTKLMSLQKQLNRKYHSNRCLRDRLMTAIDIPSIQASMRVLIPRTEQQPTNLIVNRLSEKPITVGWAYVS